MGKSAALKSDDNAAAPVASSSTLKSTPRSPLVIALALSAVACGHASTALPGTAGPPADADTESDGSTQLVLYPDPVGLDQTTNLGRSPLYSVTVDGHPTFVYRSVNRRPEFSAVKEAHFVYFSFAGGPVTLSVTKLDGDISTAVVRPRSLGITPVVTGATATFVLPTAKKFMVQIDGESQPLIVFADAPDTDIPSGPDVTRFGPGFHDIGRDYDLPENHTVYIDGGAVVKGTFGQNQPSRKGVVLRGRGIVYAGDYAWPGGGNDANGKYGIFHQALDGGKIEGIIALDSEYWNFGIRNTTTEFANIKIIGWEKNTDGIWVGPGSTAHDCFIMTDDDSIRPSTTPTFPADSATLVENMVLWHEAYGHPFYVPNYYDVQNVTLRNIEYIRSEQSYTAQSYIPSFTGSNLPRTIRNLTYENILFEEIIAPDGKPDQGGFLQWVVSAKSSIANITFRNVRTPVTSGTLMGLSATERISGVTFDGLYRDGVKMTSLAMMGVTTNAFVDGVVFQ